MITCVGSIAEYKGRVLSRDEAPSFAGWSGSLGNAGGLMFGTGFRGSQSSLMLG